MVSRINEKLSTSSKQSIHLEFGNGSLDFRIFGAINQLRVPLYVHSSVKDIEASVTKDYTVFFKFLIKYQGSTFSFS